MLANGMMTVPEYERIIKKYLKTRDFYDLPSSIRYNHGLYHDMHEIERKWMAKRPARLIIYPKDVEVIYGKSGRHARRLLQEIREEIGLPKGSPVTIRDFCKHTELDYETVHNHIMES